MLFPVAIHCRAFGSETCEFATEEELLEEIRSLLGHLGSEQFMMPDLEHTECSLTDVERDTRITLWVSGWVQLDIPGCNTSWLSCHPYEELELLLFALATRDMQTVMAFPWKAERKGMEWPWYPFYLYAANADMHDLHRAASLGNGWGDGMKWLRALLKNAQDVNVRHGKDKTTPLHRAAGAGEAEACQLLLEAGADVNAESDHKATPLCWSLLTEFEDQAGPVQEVLRKHGGIFGEPEGWVWDMRRDRMN